MLSLILRDFTQEHKTLIRVFVLLSVFLSRFSASFVVYCICSLQLEVSGNLNSSGAGKLFVSIVVSARTARLLSLLYLRLQELYRLSYFLTLSRLCKSIVSNKL